MPLDPITMFSCPGFGLKFACAREREGGRGMEREREIFNLLAGIIE